MGEGLPEDIGKRKPRPAQPGFRAIPNIARTWRAKAAQAGSMTILQTFRSRGLLAAAVALIGVTDASPGGAQGYPTQAIKIVVPFVAGGGVDVVARLIAPRLSEELGQTVIIENRGGAGGMLGAAAVAQSPPDGYTLLLGTGSTHGTNASVYSKLSYDPVRDFVPVAQVSSLPFLLVVPPSLPAKSVSELITLAHTKPGELSFGSFGTGSINHLAAELFNSMAKIQASHIPYRGSAPALTDLIAGRLHYTFDGVSTSLGYVQAGTIRVLGISSPARSPILPDVPTVSESGLAGFDAVTWSGLFAPTGTAASVVELLNRKTKAVLAAPAMKEGFAKLGMEAVGGSQDDLARKVRAEIQKWASIVREKNIRIDP
jgi:tripartite-type tricarboxylate transporter receptor subunit TctC